jgi:hypothetical protein
MSIRPRLLSRLMLGLAGLGMIVVATLAWNLRAPIHDPEADLIRQQGFPATLAELDDWYHKLPENLNAALIYTNAFAQIALASNSFYHVRDDKWIPKRGQPIAAEDSQGLEAIFSTNRAGLELLYSAATLTNSRYPTDLKQCFNTPLPHLTEMRSTIQILTAEAMFHAAKGEAEGTVQSFIVAGRANDSLSQEPLLISQLVVCANWALICRRLEWSLNATELNPEQLERLQKMLAQARDGFFYRGLVGERATGYTVFREPKWQGMLFNFTDFGATPSRSAELKSLLIVSLLKTTGFFKKDKLFYLNALSNYVALAKMPLPERFKASQSAPSFVPPSNFYLISRLLLPALTKALTRDANRAASIEVAESALAVERFRRANSNAVPDNLEQLVPGYLSAIPLDPFDGQPLRFKKHAQGYVVYSFLI